MGNHYEKYELFKNNSDMLFSESGYFCTFVHISYYSIIQYFHYLLISRGYYSNQTEVFKASKEDKSGYHNFILTQVVSKIINPKREMHLQKDVKNVQFMFRELKQYRTTADYSSDTMEYCEREKIRKQFTEFLKRVEKYGK